MKLLGLLFGLWTFIPLTGGDKDNFGESFVTLYNQLAVVCALK
jgi:hypothetical protein